MIYEAKAKCINVCIKQFHATVAGAVKRSVIEHSSPRCIGSKING